MGEWPKWRERSERLIEATDIIRRLWNGDRVTHQGKYYNVNGRLYDLPPQRIPLLMAGNGPKAMYRCGQYADGLITDPKTWKQHKAEFQKGARDAGKDPNQMPVLLEQYVIVGGRRDAERAAQLWRFTPHAFTSYFDVRDPEEIQVSVRRSCTLAQFQFWRDSERTNSGACAADRFRPARTRPTRGDNPHRRRAARRLRHLN